MSKILETVISDEVPCKQQQPVVGLSEEFEQFFVQVSWQQKALDELGETPERCEASLCELRQRIEAIKEFKPYLEDQFLLGFLRVRKFDVDRAVKSYKKFFKMRVLDPKKYFPMGEGSRELRDKFNLGVAAIARRRNPVDNTAVIILRVGSWTPDTGFDLSDLFTPAAMTLLLYGMNSASQVHGVRVILDLRGLHLGHLRYFPLSAIRALVYIVTDAFPLRFKGFHIIQDNVFFDYLFFMAKPFLTRKIQKRCHLHGSNVRGLHDHICPSILFEEYGGHDGPFRWNHFVDPMYKAHNRLVEFSYYGYDTRGKM